MDYKKVKRVARIVLIIWILFAGYLYGICDNRDLFEYVTFLLIGIYISFDIKSDWKYLLVFLLTWNVVDECSVIFGSDSFKLFALIPLFVGAVKLFRTKINKVKQLTNQEI